MKMKGLCRLGMLMALVIALHACASGKKQYDMGMQLSQAGKKKEAIAHLEQAIAQEPKNEKYQKALSDLQASLTTDLLREAENILKAESPPSISAIAEAKAKIQQAKKMNPNHPAVLDSEAGLRRAEKSLVAKVKELYSRATRYIQAEQWLEGQQTLQQLQRLYPGYEDTKRLEKQTTDKGSQAFYQQGKALFDSNDFKGSAALLRNALTLKGDHQDARELLALANERDNKEYFIEQAQQAAAEQNWDAALQAIDRALAYAPGDPNIIGAKNNMQSKAGIYHVRQGKSHMYGGWLFKAFENYQQAARHTGNLKNPEVGLLVSGFKTELSARAASLAGRLKDAGQYGSAWFWYTKIKQIDPDHPDIFYLIQAMEDEIIKRLEKSIAVFDFGSPSYAPDAGSIFANNLSTFLFKSASKDVKILERENLKSILEEMKLGQIGVVSSQTAKEMGRVYGIDVAVMGSVLRYNVDSTSYADTKTVTYQVKKTEENIEYLNWKARNPNPTREQLDLAPVPYINKMTDVEKEYNVSTHKKVAFVTVSFRIVDVSTGENILVDTIPRTKTATDETSAGVQIAGIKYDPLEIPTDTELLQELTNEVVTELGQEALQPLKYLEKTYFEYGERQLQRRANVKAAEHFVDAVFDEKLKGIQNSQLTTKALQNLEDIFRAHKVQLEG